MVDDFKYFAVEVNCTCHLRCFDCSFVGSDAILGTCYNRMCTSQDRVNSSTNHCLLLLISTNLVHSDCFILEPVKRHGYHWPEWSCVGWLYFWAELPERQCFDYWIRHTLVIDWKVDYLFEILSGAWCPSEIDFRHQTYVVSQYLGLSMNQRATS